MSDKNLAMETIDWWRLSSPCLCNLSLRHTEISSLITDYYIINEMLYGLACVALTDVTLVALFIAILVICDSSKKIFPAQMFELFQFSQFRSSSEKTNSSVRSHENAKCRFRFYSIAAIERFSSEFHSVALKFFSVFLDYTPGIELINRDTRRKREYHFQ